MRPTSKWLSPLFVLVITAMACALPSQLVPQQVVTVVATVVVTQAATAGPVVQAAATATTAPQAATLAPSATTALQAAQTPAATDTPSPEAGPQCTVIATLNLRNGPGTAYYPVEDSFDPGTVLIPTGYNPVGNPAGAWVQIIVQSTGKTGWVSSGSEYLQCTIDLTTLPTIVVKPPPPPPLPMVTNLPAQGPKSSGIDLNVEISRQYLMRIGAHQHGNYKDGEGIDHVLFMVYQNGKQLYKASEGTAKYCIFKGGEPDCNPWPKSNGQYVWGAGGPQIVSGDYSVIVHIALKSDPTNEYEWIIPINIQMP